MEKVKIEIVFDPNTNNVGVTAPLENKVLCLGMLAMAQKLVQDFDPAKQQERPHLIVPRGTINGLKN